MQKVIPNLSTTLILIFISLVLIVLDNFHFLSWPKGIIYFLTNPISFGIYQTKQDIGKEFKFIVTARKTAQETKALQDQMAQILSENADLRTRLAETEAQLEQQQSLDPKTYNLLAARPIGLERFLKIDAGSSSGIKINQPVVFKDNYIGQVVSLSEKGANIKLLTDPDSKIAAFSLGKVGRAKGILIGQFGQELLFDKILHEEQINEGDLVYSEGTEGFLPRGLILGTVTKVLQKENEVFKQALVKPVFDISDLELVFVVQE